MDYNKIFTKIMYNSKNPMEGAIDIFNTIAFERNFEHKALKLDNSGNDISDDESWTPETVSDISKELKYWYSLYFEDGHIRHDQEYRKRNLIKKAIDFLESYNT